LPGTRDASVHLAEFPSDVERFVDDELTGRWQRLMTVRDEVNRALETARQAKTIGNALGARVTLRARGDLAGLLERHAADLPMLFIVSHVDLEPATGDEDELEVSVSKAEGEKCARCWRIVPSVSAAADTLGICDRCERALAASAGPIAR
jgi:isoleucyl-tRNA synthetase